MYCLLQQSISPKSIDVVVQFYPSFTFYFPLFWGMGMYDNGFGIKKGTFKVARYSFPGPIPPKFEHKLRRHKQSFEKIATTVVLDKDENLL